MGLTGRQLHPLGLYQEFFRAMRVKHMTVAPLPFRPPLQFGFSCAGAVATSQGGSGSSWRTQPYCNAETLTRLTDEAGPLTRASTPPGGE